MTGLARWCFRHCVLVLMIWLVLLGGVALTGKTLGTGYATGFSIAGTESSRAQSLLSTSGLQGRGGDDTIVVHARAGTVTDPPVRAQVRELVSKVAALPGVASVGSPYAPRAPNQISPDHRTAFATVSFVKPNQQLTTGDLQRVVDAGSTARSSTLQVEFGGLGFQSLKGRPAAGSEAIGILAAAIVLVIAFGSLFAMAIPLISAILALGAGVETIRLLSNVLSINSLAPTVAALIGLGVGIDYALFIVTRHRDGLRAGLSPEESAVTALNTSGRAVLFAGGTVTVAMLGLLVLRVSFLTGVGVAAAVIVAFAVAAAITLLPAVFGLLGVRVLSRRERRARAGESSAEPSAEPGVAASTAGGWSRWAAVVQRRPVLLSGLALAVLVPLIIPAFAIRLGSSDQGNDPASATTRKAYDLLAEGFGAGHNGPLELVAQAPGGADQTALNSLVLTLKSVPGVASVAAPPPAPGSAISVVQVVPTTSPQSNQTADLIDHLRHGVIPRAETGTGLHVYVGGQTATFQDFAHVLSAKLPLFIAVVVLLGCILLMLAFRSVVIPLTAAVMNLLAAGASFGVVVAVFQWGWGSTALGLGRPGPIEAFLPVMLIAILFGLSMDYQVFLVSRMHEEWRATRDNHRAVRVGQAATGRVITAAAAIMICVFLAFVFGGRRPIGEFGLGLATAILLDALMLRTVLVPAAMHVFGRANWWLPRRLDRALPHLSVDRAGAAPAEPAVLVDR